MRWTTNKAQSDYMREMVRKNLSASLNNAAENWAARRLKETKLGWKRQAQWGCRIFDFYCGAKGVAVEIDGPEHDPEYDAYRDKHNFLRSCIIVYRVRNFDEARMSEVIAEVIALPFFRERKKQTGMTTHAHRRAALAAAGMKPAHAKWRPPDPTQKELF